MKRFIIKSVLFFILPVILLLVIQEIALRSIPNDYSYKNQWLTKNAKKVHILSLGSSHGYYDIQPAVFSKLAFNAGHVSQSVEFDAIIFDKFINSLDSLEYVILPVSYFTLYNKGLQFSEENWRVKYYTIYYDCPKFKYNPEFAFECYRFDLITAIKALAKKVNHIDCDSLGHGTDYKLANRDEDWKESGPKAMKRHTYKDVTKETWNQNVFYIKHIVSTCEKKGVKVILLTTPTYHTYYDVLDKEQLQRTINFCQNIASTHKNATYLNWLRHPNFNEHDFYDADHLNEFGAVKLTSLLDKEFYR